MTPVLITTDNRGVYFGHLLENKAPEMVRLARARVVVQWDTPQGFLYMAVKGPQGVAEVSPAVGDLEVYGVAAVAVCSPEAAEAWDNA